MFTSYNFDPFFSKNSSSCHTSVYLAILTFFPQNLCLYLAILNLNLNFDLYLAVLSLHLTRGFCNVFLCDKVTIT